MYPIELQKKLNEVAAKYTKLFQLAVRNEFNKERLKASGLLAQSVRARYESATAQTAPQIVIEYDNYGDYIGARRLIWTKSPPVDKLQEWIEDKGDKFRMKVLPGYVQGRSSPGISRQKQTMRIAFAIAKKLRFRQRLTRRYKWRRASLPDVLRSMNFDIINAWTAETEQIIAEALMGKKQTA